MFNQCLSPMCHIAESTISRVVQGDKSESGSTNRRRENAYQDDRTIDLHELKVAEALSCLESFIVQSIRGP